MKANATQNIVEEFVYCLFRGENMMPILHYLPPSPPCRSVLLCARMIGVEFDLRAVNILEKEQLKPEFVQINPQHCIPTLDDQGLVLWESRAILTYLVSAYAKDDSLYTKDIRVRAVIDQRLQFDLGTLYQRMADYYFPVIFHGATFDDSRKSKLDEAVGWFDLMLKGNTWAAGKNFSVADISLVVTVSQIEAFGFDLSSFGRVSNWLQKCKEKLGPYGYDEINDSGADVLAQFLRAKIET